MKFGWKLTMAITSLLCVSLSLGGTWMIHTNFLHARDELLRQTSQHQLRERYALETAFSQEGNQSLYAIAAQYEKEQRAWLPEAAPSFSVFGDNGTVLYSNLPHSISYTAQQAAVAAGETKARFVQTGETFFLLMGTPLRGLGRSLWLVSAYDVTPQFQERDRQIRQYLAMQLVALVLIGTAAFFVSRFLTRPLKHLEAASRAISEGKTGVRVQNVSGDELKHLGDAFNEMACALESQMELLREEAERQKRFVAAFTHELKTPMTAILGYADLLRSREIPTEKRRRAADYIYQESNRIEALSRELLLLLKLEKGEIVLRPVSVSAVFSDVLRSFPEPSFRFNLVNKEDAVVQADRILLTALLRNLVLNAAAAEPKDEMVTLRCEHCADGIRLSVEDRGRGIPKEELSRIREPFYRVDKSRARENGGSGLGLTICSMIAQLHESPLEIESWEGEGTRVWVVLREVRA